MYLEIYSRRWGRNEKYKVEKTATGWDISHMRIEGPCDKTGAPALYKNFDQDSINYPEELPGYMEWLWTQAHDQSLSNDQIQVELDRLGEWIQITEKASPKGIFDVFK